MLFVSYEELQKHINHSCNIPSRALDAVMKYEFAFECDPAKAYYCTKHGCQKPCRHTCNPDGAKNFDLIYESETRKKYFENQKSGWIPCSERLPEEDGQYLITVKYVHVDGYDDIYAEHGEWADGKWDMFFFGHCGQVESILAWMPLPAPYKKEGEQ